MSIDRFDVAILRALQADSDQTHAKIGEQIHLSASQVSRRRTALEKLGLISGYGAKLDPQALGFGLRAITRVNLRSHGEDTAAAFARFLERHGIVRTAWSVSGDADYVLHIETRTLADFAEFVHRELLPHPQVAQVRSEIVLTTVKDDKGLPI
ncbi:MAG: Lrp/AsnC family transcriptional regulator [Ahrensia sp.]|nr:Lrp/AsnC family transcriptional regulator [Ahrensia sp.]